ncbi:MAG TPA: hypothetical protein VMW67_06815 [Desulfobacteria bacterium]|nr:hypothetical protein [Desulfobacteria bacterium]
MKIDLKGLEEKKERNQRDSSVYGDAGGLAQADAGRGVVEAAGRIYRFCV